MPPRDNILNHPDYTSTTVSHPDWLKILSSPKPSQPLNEIWTEGELASLPSYLQQADRVPAGPQPWHTGSVLEHMGHNMDAVAGDPLAVWMALTHDLGKLTTPENIWPHHYGHEERGVELAQDLGQAFGLAQNFIQAGKLAARLHMRAGRYPTLRVGKKETF